MTRVSLVLTAALLAGCAAPVSNDSANSKAREGFTGVDDLMVVDCLLPPEVRQMGNFMFNAPRRPVRATAGECALRGGEFVAYDRADYRSALKVWMPKAEDGDALAQTYVGEIFEKGLGTTPDYTSAAAWYQRAAEQGHAQAQIALGYLYEQGKGVEQDVVKAMNYYRAASGASDTLVFQQEALAEQRVQYEKLLNQSEQELAVLRQQLKTSLDALADERARSGANAQAARDREAQLAVLQRIVDEAETKVADNRQVLRSIPQQASNSGDLGLAKSTVRDSVDFGRYYALIFGLEQYASLDTLESPHEDANRLASVLSDKYGFETQVMLDANQREILSAINDLRQRVTERDSVVIYFAGHGNMISPKRDPSIQEGFWLPVEATDTDVDGWIPNPAINSMLSILPARGVLVVADSCFGGALSNDRRSLLANGSGAISPLVIQNGLKRSSRHVLSSGGLRPVLDAGGGSHSVFARALIEVLEENEQIIREGGLFQMVAQKVRQRSGELGFDQTPELKPIRAAGHAAGHFFFVPS